MCPTARNWPHRASLLVLATSALVCSPALGQLDLSWCTVDGGGGSSSGGGLTVTGTIGQPDAGALSAGALTVACGFWAAANGLVCYANCDNSTAPPVLNVNDFNCFLNQFAAGSAYANCDNSTAPPVLNVNDFNCFLNKFAAGCP